MATENSRAFPWSWPVWTKRVIYNSLSDKSSALHLLNSGPEAAPCCHSCLCWPKQGLQQGGPLFSYLSDRSMALTYKGAQSSMKKLPGGGPQGALLGGIIFMLKYNGAFLRPPIPRGIIGPVVDSKAKTVKYVDDGTVAVSINLKKCLISNISNQTRPFNYRERTEHSLPSNNNVLQFYVQ